MSLQANEHIIYGLLDPVTTELRYIGYTSFPLKAAKGKTWRLIDGKRVWIKRGGKRVI